MSLAVSPFPSGRTESDSRDSVSHSAGLDSRPERPFTLGKFHKFFLYTQEIVPNKSGNVRIM
jgi:hypothetical protein